MGNLTLTPGRKPAVGLRRRVRRDLNFADIAIRKEAEAALDKAGEELERQVSARRDGTSKTNGTLAGQVRRGRRLEKKIEKIHEELERQVRQRTAELWHINRALKAEIVQRKRAEEAHLEVLRRHIEAQEAERCRVARELHDQFGQELAALSLGLCRVREELPAQSPLGPRLAQLSKIVGQALHDVHSLVWKMRPPALDDLGLAAALRRYTGEWAKLSGTPVHFRHRGLHQRVLPVEIETTLYRIAQEALTNVFKHAHAKCVEVRLEYRAGHLRLVVKDDGRGFLVEPGSNAGPGPLGRLGLVGIRERASLVGGAVLIESAPGSGTTVFVKIPLARQPVGRERVAETNSRSAGRRGRRQRGSKSRGWQAPGASAKQ